MKRSFAKKAGPSTGNGSDWMSAGCTAFTVIPVGELERRASHERDIRAGAFTNE